MGDCSPEDLTVQGGCHFLPKVVAAVMTRCEVPGTGPIEPSERRIGRHQNGGNGGFVAARILTGLPGDSCSGVEHEYACSLRVRSALRENCAAALDAALKGRAAAEMIGVGHWVTGCVEPQPGPLPGLGPPCQFTTCRPVGALPHRAIRGLRIAAVAGEKRSRAFSNESSWREPVQFQAAIAATFLAHL